MEEEFKNDTAYLDQHFLIDKSVINKLIDASSHFTYSALRI